MRLSTKFISFIIVIHSVTIALSFYIFRDNKLIFIASEFFIILSLLVCWSLYNELIAPLNLLMTGIDAMRDKDFNVKFRPTGKYEMDELINVYNKMIDEIRIERTAQQEQYFFLEKLIETSPTGIIILDFDEKIASLNPKAQSILGLKEDKIKGQSIHNLDIPFIKNIAELKKNESKTFHTEGVKKYKIQKAEFIDRGFPRSCVMIEELTLEILEAEKQAYGKVIRMMAHEVNNSIGAVNSILDTSLSIETDKDVAHALQIAIDRNDHLNHFMRNFADVIRLPEPRKEHFSIDDIVKNAANLMQFKAQERGIHFEFKISPTPLSIYADLGQIEQVLINIIKNAIEAITGDNGKIIFKIDTTKKCIEIIDNGKGIPDDKLHLLFSPFFTDKPNGQGIGLTLIRDILTNHNFLFSLKTIDNSTIFKIEF